MSFFVETLWVDLLVFVQDFGGRFVWELCRDSM